MKIQSLTDQELIARYVHQSCSKSIEELIRRYKRPVMGYIRKQIADKELVSDLFQDTFMKAIITMKSGRYNEEGKFIHWIIRIAHNLIIDYYRHQKKMPAVRDTEEYDVMANLRLYDKNIEEDLITKQIHKDVRKLVAHLPDSQREVVQLRMYNEMSFKDIAERTNVSINTALGRMRYALMNMKKMIDENHINLNY